MIGKNLLNYEIKSVLGRGGMAIVYMAQHTLTGEKVAVKVLNADLVKNENIRKRFVSEAKNLARMSHRNIIKVRDLVEEEHTVAFVMDCVHGQTLKDLLESNGKLSDSQIRDIFLQLLDALSYVHQYGLVHRDVKPSNFMMDHQNNLFLMDFGIAKIMDATSAEYTITGTGAQLGTPMYMSPEQVTETRNVTFSSDIYSSGVLLWQMVTGKKPYDLHSTSNFQLQTKIVNEPLSYTHTKWDQIIQKATQKDPQNRYDSCLEFKNQFVKCSDSSSEDETIIDDKKGKTQPVKKSSSSSTLVAFIIVFGLICLVLIGVGIYNELKPKVLNDNGVIPIEDTNQSDDSKKEINSEEIQKNTIRELYASFDQAFTYNAMNAYIQKYYDPSYINEVKISELNSYGNYLRKSHIIEEITKDESLSKGNLTCYRLDFIFDFQAKSGKTGRNKCTNLIYMNDQNKIERIKNLNR
jgi:serine/threonine protein kinase